MHSNLMHIAHANSIQFFKITDVTCLKYSPAQRVSCKSKWQKPEIDSENKAFFFFCRRFEQHPPEQ